MKKLLLFVFVFVALSGFAQEKTLPSTEFSVSLSEKVVTLKAGETKQITVNILKSKAYSRFETKLGVSSSLPAGLSVSYEPAEGMFETSTVSISAAQDAKVGEYQVVLKSNVKNTIKGSIVKIIIENGSASNAVSAN